MAAQVLAQANATMRLRSTATPARRADFSADADRFDMLSLHRPVEDDPKDDQDGRHDQHQVRHAPEAADGQVGEVARVCELQRDAARVGIIQSDDHGASAEGRNESVHTQFGDDDFIDDADRCPDRDDDQHCDRNRQLIEAQQSHQQEAAEARDVADAEVEVSGDERDRKTSRHDGPDRHVVQDIAEVADRRERPRLGDRECRQHRDQHDDCAVSSEQPEDGRSIESHRRLSHMRRIALGRHPQRSAFPPRVRFRDRVAFGHEIFRQHFGSVVRRDGQAPSSSRAYCGLLFRTWSTFALVTIV